MKENKNLRARIIIIGGGIAGLSVAEEIRKNSAKAQITIISKEEYLPYYRLSLTRYLAGEINKESLIIHPRGWYDENRIELILGKEAVKIAKEDKLVELNDGLQLKYDKLVICAGANPFIPRFRGVEQKNVVTVRSIEDADNILERLEDMDSCICIGGGLLGIETAGAIAKRGIKVILFESAEWLLPFQLNRKASALIKKHINEMGIEVREGKKIEEIMGEGVCEGVRLEDGEEVKAKMIIITTGVRPDLNIVRNFELELNKGLLADDKMQTSSENIYTAGDISEHRGKTYGLWNVALLQAKIAARNAVGIQSLFTGVPGSAILKVLGVQMFSIGEVNPKDEGYCQYEIEKEGCYCLFVLKDNKIVGSIIIGDRILANKTKLAVENGLEFTGDLYNNAENISQKLVGS